MKAYVTEISGRLIAQQFKAGRIISDCNERLSVESGVPASASLVAVRFHEPYGSIEMLWLTDEEGELPEAVDIWFYAERVYISHRTEVLQPA